MREGFYFCFFDSNFPVRHTCSVHC